MKGMEIIERAEGIVEDYLSLIEVLAATKQFQAESQSRLVCRCPSCKSARSRTLLWVGSMREAPAPAEASQPSATSNVLEHYSEEIALDS
jgi:hypothetical protein